MSARQGWNAAQLASERKPKKPVSRIGDVPTLPLFPHSRHQCRTSPDTHCAECGYHVCSCAKTETAPTFLTVTVGRQAAEPVSTGIRDIYNSPFMFGASGGGVCGTTTTLSGGSNGNSSGGGVYGGELTGTFPSRQKPALCPIGPSSDISGPSYEELALVAKVVRL